MLKGWGRGRRNGHGREVRRAGEWEEEKGRERGT